MPSFKHETAPFIQEDIGEISMAKVMPQDLMAEQAIIGACILNPEIIPTVEAIISPDDLYSERHKSLLQAIYDLRNVLDLVSLCNRLPAHKDYISSLTEAISTSAGHKHHAEIIKNLSDKRKIITILQNGLENAFIANKELPDTLSEVKEGILDIEKNQPDEIESNHQFFTKAYELIYQKKDPGLYMGIDCLDNFYFEKGYLHNIAAESGVGKSAFLLQIADNMANKYGACLFYSLESTRYRLAFRLIARHSHVALTRINKSHFTGIDQEEKIMKAMDDLIESKLILIDNPKYQEIEKLVSHTESYALKVNVKAVFVDYLQIIGTTRTDLKDKGRVDKAVMELKKLAKNLDVPVIYACQLRKDIQHKPSLDDLYESNVIRQATDNILFLYAPDSNPVEYPVELFLAKGKDQERFSQWLNFNGNYQEFTEGEKPTADTPKKKKTWWQDNE